MATTRTLQGKGLSHIEIVIGECLSTLKILGNFCWERTDKNKEREEEVKEQGKENISSRFTSVYEHVPTNLVHAFGDGIYPRCFSSI
jgi:hypothetical protein